MSDTRKKDSQLPPTASGDDDDIIELVEEIGEESPRHPLSALERKLLDIGEDHRNAVGRDLDDLPDIAELGRIDFEEEDEEVAQGQGHPAEGEGGEAPGASATADPAWLLEPDPEPDPAAAEKRPPAPLNEIEEIAEFDEQFLDAEDLLEGLSAPPANTAAGEGEDLELFDIEEDDGDDEIVWFDDLDKPDQEASAGEPPPEEIEPEAPLLDIDAASVPDTSAADVFAAHVESARSDADTAFPLAATAAGAGTELAGTLEAAAIQAPAESPPGVPPPAAEDERSPALPGLSPEEIEAAVERVMTRKLGGTIEAIILQAIEKAVSKEIERLKSLLLEDETGGPTP